MQSISILIPAFNEEKYISRLLTSLSQHQLQSVDEIIVIDNNSTDKTAFIAQGFKNVRVIKEERKGVVWARNRGLQEAKNDIVVFLDADTAIGPQWEKNLVEAFKDEHTVCVSGPCIYDDISKIQQFLVKLYWYIACFIIYPIIGYMGLFANLALRKSVLQSIGGIDTKIEFYGDDTNITRRLSKVGKVKFIYSFFVYASGRRFQHEGVVKTGFTYALNFFSEAVLRRPLTKGYTEVR